ncbi:MAG: tRNA lysidine(34) synthetase TilS, partial [Proteobacteria bacterium]|nr:tRNA lysidine(34) synthetase TilS [Pseudomonadota bacterium]
MKGNPLPPNSLITLSHSDWQRVAMYPKGLLIACSGGVDSISLLHSFATLNNMNHANLGVLHLNFHLRESSDHDENFVQRLSEQYQLPFFSYHPYPLFQRSSYKHSKKPWTSFELWARKVRLDCFKLFQYRGYAIVLAHHLDDQYETVFFRMLRGSQPWNLRGLRRWHQGLFRPLLQHNKGDLIQYARRHSLCWRTDATNNELLLARNRLRHVIIPETLKVHPYASQHMLDLATSSTHLLDHAKKHVARHIQQGCLDLKAAQLSHPTIMQVALETLAESSVTITTKHLREALLSVGNRGLATPRPKSAVIRVQEGTFYQEGNRMVFFAAINYSCDTALPKKTYQIAPGMLVMTELSGYHRRCKLRLRVSTENQVGGGHMPYYDVTVISLKEYLTTWHHFRGYCSKENNEWTITGRQGLLGKVVSMFNRSRHDYDVFPDVSLNLLCVCLAD